MTLPRLEFLESRSAGDVWALWQLWHSLGLEDLAQAWRSTRSEIDVLACLRLMVFNRLCDPSSKLGVLRWMDTVALPRGFGLADGSPDHQHLLRAMDVLDDHSAAIADRLSVLMRPLIDQDLSVVFYDLTAPVACRWAYSPRTRSPAATWGNRRPEGSRQPSMPARSSITPGRQGTVTRPGVSVDVASR
jgi:hypothetical protein